MISFIISMAFLERFLSPLPSCVPIGARRRHELTTSCARQYPLSLHLSPEEEASAEMENVARRISRHVQGARLALAVERIIHAARLRWGVWPFWVARRIMDIAFRDGGKSRTRRSGYIKGAFLYIWCCISLLFLMYVMERRQSSRM